MAKAAVQEVLTHKSRDHMATKLALAVLICVRVRSGCFAGWEYISAGRWWATLMRHYLPTGAPSPLASGVGVAAFAAVLVASGRGALGATSGLPGALCGAVALAAVAVAADQHSAATQGAQKASGRWWRRGLSSGHERAIPMRELMLWTAMPAREILTAAPAPSKAVGLGARQWVARKVTVTVAPASCTGRRYVTQNTSAAPDTCADSGPLVTAQADTHRTHLCPAYGHPPTDPQKV